MTTRGAGRNLVAHVAPRHAGESFGAQEARGRPLRTLSHPPRAARMPVRERGHNFWGGRGHKQTDHFSGPHAPFATIQSLSAGSRRCARRSCHHQGLADSVGSVPTYAIMTIEVMSLAIVQHRHPPARGLLSLISLLSAFLLTGIKRNQTPFREKRTFGVSAPCVFVLLVPRDERPTKTRRLRSPIPLR